MISFRMKITRATRVGKTLEHPETANLNRGERQQIITGHFRLYGYIRPFKQILQIFDIATPSCSSRQIFHHDSTFPILQRSW